MDSHGWRSWQRGPSRIRDLAQRGPRHGGRARTMPRGSVQRETRCVGGLALQRGGVAKVEDSGGADERAPDRAQANSICPVEGLQQEKK
jgi:hypothetical protein